jgi:AcrR family transcriptional regulator
MARRTLLKLDERLLSWVISEGAAKGIEGISTSRIASQLRISEPTIFVHFGSKANLLFEADRSSLHTLYSSLVPSSEENPRKNAIDALLFLAARAQENPKEAAYAYLYHTLYDLTSFEMETQALIALFKTLKPFETNTNTLLLLEDTLGDYAYRASQKKIGLDEPQAEKMLNGLLILLG